MHSRTARNHIVAVAVMASTLLPTAAAAAATSEEVRSANSGAIDDWVTERLAAQDVPGAAVAVVRDGEIVHLAGYGEAGPADRPVTPDTPFIIGSSSKPFTALVVQQLVAEGRLSLDEAVAPHLRTVTGTVPNGFEDATVGQLLNHTGGLSMMVGLAGTVDVHRGDDALERLPGVGPVLAARITADRLAHGPYTSPAGLLRVRGVGRKTFANVKRFVMVATPPPGRSSALAALTTASRSACRVISPRVSSMLSWATCFSMATSIQEWGRVILAFRPHRPRLAGQATKKAAFPGRRSCPSGSVPAGPPSVGPCRCSTNQSLV
jgi:hypothetical protein